MPGRRPAWKGGTAGAAGGPYAGETPLIRQYLQMRDQAKGTLLLYRLGDFFECFFDDAVRLSRDIGLTLTHRGTDSSGRKVPMCGIPANNLDQYLARIVKLGVSVSICEQVGEPGAAGSAIMERRIVRVVTPGTVTDSGMLPEKRDSVLMAALPSKLKNGEGSFAWLTLTSGGFRAAKASPAETAALISRIEPSEILVTEDGRQRLEGLIPEGAAVTLLQDWYFDGERGAETLMHRFRLQNLDAWGVSREPGILAAANALLSYVEQTQREAAPFIEPLKLEAESDHILLDPATRRNLEITETIRGEAAPTLLSTVDLCRTAMGSRTLRGWLTRPLRDQAQARARHAAVEEILEAWERCAPMEELLSALPDIERTAGRIALGSVRPREAAALRDAMPALSKLSKFLESFSSPLLGQIAAGLMNDGGVEKLLAETLLDEPAPTLKDGDVIRSEASPELAGLRKIRDNAGAGLADLEAREKARTGLAALRVEYNRVAGFYIELPRGQAKNAPEDYHRRQTLKNTERFITPELKDYENKVLSAGERIRQLEKTLWDGLVEKLAARVPELQAAARAAAALDVLAAFARKARESGWCRPELSPLPGIEIAAGRHPVVEMQAEGYVPSGCRLVPGRRLLIITGPNMGGKSTYMRMAALVVILASAGSFVPAEAARIGPVDRVLTRIGASDDLARGRSTFMVEMTEAAAILHQATASSLVLMDEIGRGTSTFDGLSLASAIARELAESVRAWTLFATHYFELTQLPSLLPEAANVHVSAEQARNTIVFMHSIEEGPASQSYGIAVASLAGIPARVTRRARQTLARLEERSVASGPQLDLFAGLAAQGEPEEEAREEAAPEAGNGAAASILEDLRTLDADALSPREALQVLYELKDRAIGAK